MNTAKIEIVKMNVADVVTASGCGCFVGGVITTNSAEDDC